MRFFCMDLHISVIEDFKATCPFVEVVDWSLSGHHWVMNKEQKWPEHINPSNWERMDLNMIKNFQDTYDDFLKTFDGFIVCHVTAFAMIYEKYNVPVIMINSCRYDLPFCMRKNTEMIANLNACLQKLQTNGLLLAVSNNKADQLYTLKGSGIRTHHMPSLCLYTGMKYNPIRSTFLCYHGRFPEHRLISYKQDRFQWKDIAEYRGVIHFPYEVSTMSMFEHFTAGLPLFFPSKKLWKKTPNIQSISAYGGSLDEKFGELRDLNTWIELSDLYEVFQSPNTYYFDSNEHLFRLLQSFQYVDDTEFRKKHIERIQTWWQNNLPKTNLELSSQSNSQP
jgi:hypothetical protein